MRAQTHRNPVKPRKQIRVSPSKPAGALSGVWIYAALFLATLAVYWQVREFDFVNYDDPEYVITNNHVRQGITAESIKWAVTSTEAANWFPLTRASHLLDVQLFRFDAGMHHLVNVAIHAGAVLLLFAFLKRSTRALWPSAFVAFVFALHPLHVESVAWISERKDVLSGFFWFLTLLLYVRYVERPGSARYLTTLGVFFMGLLSKPMIVTLPFVLLLIDFWPLHRTGPGKERLPDFLWEKVPFFALLAAIAISTYLVQAGSRAVKTLDVFPLELRVENALVSYVTYIGDFFWPTRLAVFYPYPPEISVFEALLAGTVLLAISVAAASVWRKRPYVAVGWFWFAGTLLPVIGLVQIGAQSRADRYMYVPMVGLLITVAWGACDLVVRWPALKTAVTALAAAACVACAVLADMQVSYWKNSQSLFAHALAVTRGNYVAEHNLGLAISDEGKWQEAAVHYKAALSIRPDSVEAHSDLGNALSNLGQLRPAAAEYEAALRLAPGSAIPHNNLGNTFFRMGMLDRAIAEYEAAIRLQPQYAEAHNDLGAALASSGQMKPAIDQFRAALRINPDYAQARTNLELALKGSSN